ncbi:Hypothetical protein AKI40_1167 [Enterobacter sp. FY-07]|uniref:hypothetical protein n=1 Tax=Kosakonia oryzendophytica TaxID=1005665 RepID=UPI0007774933|nr:hypothetical protein [Kosakonia oryzendophytica]AMO47585.1 Hypothetical protein AKI40_1167 [Enterobacter sp. FY-07]WBT59298.1 hypothetical protein O9K67_05775 [Kosakonia oryzendophytica]
MKRFLFTTEVKRAEGSQTFRVDAETEEEALEILENGGGDIYAHDVEVVDIGEFEFDHETNLDDFGDFPEGGAA